MKTTLERPADSAGAILSGLALQQRERARTLSDLARLRKEASAEIERLIAFLDQSDPYVMTELEEDSAEPSDAEIALRGRSLLPGDEDEPSLGSFDRMTDQTKSWRQGALSEIDAEHDTADLEPILSSLDHDHSQERWAAGGRRDLEQDPAESGIGDHDGLLEQVGTQDWQQGAMA